MQWVWYGLLVVLPNAMAVGLSNLAPRLFTCCTVERLGGVYHASIAYMRTEKTHAINARRISAGEAPLETPSKRRRELAIRRTFAACVDT